MLEFPKWKVWLVSLVVAAGVLLSIPSLIAGTPYGAMWPKWLPQYKINLGLDLAGGSHLLLEADAQDALKQRLQAKEDEVATELRRDPKIDVGDISTAGGRLSFLVRDPTQIDAAVERMRRLSQPVALTGNRDWDVQVVDSTRIVLTPTPAGTTQALKDAMGVARDVVRRRIDPGGTKEITVVTEGGNRILVEVPGVEEPILGGNARISGSFTVQSAHDLAVSLASGKLPVKLNVIEERTVSAELGQDSIHKGAIASIISVLMVVAFMLVTYGRFGVYANIALVVNAFLILGVMAMFNATLTLPGIAGFILTIGAAVDANVLINERIREEIRRGRRLIDAVETGYHEAFRAIFDANVTHVISAAIMAYFGSGPVRGFAVVLLIGVVTSVFTAVYFTRMLVALWIRRARPRELHI